MTAEPVCWPLVASAPPALVAITGVVFAPITIVAVTLLANRLLGVRRGWVELLVSGVLGWTAALVLAGLLSQWNWSSGEMVAITVLAGAVLTMGAAVVLDLLAPPHTLSAARRQGSSPCRIRSATHARVYNRSRGTARSCTSHVSLAELLGYFGLAAAAVLALRVVAAIVRDGTL